MRASKEKWVNSEDYWLSWMISCRTKPASIVRVNPIFLGEFHILIPGFSLPISIIRLENVWLSISGIRWKKKQIVAHIYNDNNNFSCIALLILSNFSDMSYMSKDQKLIWHLRFQFKFKNTKWNRILNCIGKMISNCWSGASIWSNSRCS